MYICMFAICRSIRLKINTLFIIFIVLRNSIVLKLETKSINRRNERRRLWVFSFSITRITIFYYHLPVLQKEVFGSQIFWHIRRCIIHAQYLYWFLFSLLCSRSQYLKTQNSFEFQTHKVQHLVLFFATISVAVSIGYCFTYIYILLISYNIVFTYFLDVWWKLLKMSKMLVQWLKCADADIMLNTDWEEAKAIFLRAISLISNRMERSFIRGWNTFP